MSRCPAREVLQKLLAERLSDSDCAALEEHLGQCAACQATLDQLARDPTTARWRRLHAQQEQAQHLAEAAFLPDLAEPPGASGESSRAAGRQTPGPAGGDTPDPNRTARVGFAGTPAAAGGTPSLGHQNQATMPPRPAARLSTAHRGRFRDL
jgi:hypothetical protein